MIDDTKEYIACSAIHYDNGKKYSFMEVYGIQSGFVLCGLRHPYIAVILPTNVYYEQDILRRELPIQWSSSMENLSITEGFMTSHGRFIDREEAKKIAIACGQCKEEEIHSDSLYSEDVFKHQRYYAR